MNQNFSTLLFQHCSLNIHKLFHNSSYILGCHYDTLRLQKNCTSKDIRNSFIKLSKEHHPDINKSPNSHKRFLEIQEAYNVLSKPGSRASYDLGLSNPERASYQSTSRSRRAYYYGGDPWYHRPPHTRNPWDDPSFYHNRDRSQDAHNENAPYYGIRGIKRQSNGTIAFIIVVFAATMFFVQMMVIRQSYAKQQMLLNKRSMLAQQHLNEAKERAERNGNQVQLEIHRKQFEEMDRLRAERAASLE